MPPPCSTPTPSSPSATGRRRQSPHRRGARPSGIRRRLLPHRPGSVGRARRVARAPHVVDDRARAERAAPSSTWVRSARAAWSTSSSTRSRRGHPMTSSSMPAAISPCAEAPQRIGLEHPYDSRRAIGVIEVTDAALCASATNRRAWGDGLHHVLDARTGEPVRTIAATWAVAPTAMVADAIGDRAVLRRRTPARPRVGRGVGADDDRRPRRVVTGQ